MLLYNLVFQVTCLGLMACYDHYFAGIAVGTTVYIHLFFDSYFVLTYPALLLVGKLVLFELAGLGCISWPRSCDDM